MSTESEAAPDEGQEQSSAPATEVTNGLDEQAGATQEAGEAASSGDDPQQAKTPKGVQKRLDEYRRQLGDQQRLNERLVGLLEKGGMSAKQAEQQVEEHAEPVKSQYANHEDYLEARADWQVEKKVREITERQAEATRRDQAKQSAQAVEATWDGAVEKAKAKYDDFEDVAYADPKDGGPRVTPVMADAIKTSDIGPEIAYWLGKNQDESKRIAALSPAAQAREIGKIEVQIADQATKAKKVSNAPEPIDPVGGKKGASGTELRADLPMDEFVRRFNADSKRAGRRF